MKDKLFAKPGKHPFSDGSDNEDLIMVIKNLYRRYPDLDKVDISLSIQSFDIVSRNENSLIISDYYNPDGFEVIKHSTEDYYIDSENVEFYTWEHIEPVYAEYKVFWDNEIAKAIERVKEDYAIAKSQKYRCADCGKRCLNNGSFGNIYGYRDACRIDFFFKTPFDNQILCSECKLKVFYEYAPKTLDDVKKLLSE